MPEARIKELDSVVLTTDLPEYGAAKDEVGTVVLVQEGGNGFTVQFMTLTGNQKLRPWSPCTEAQTNRQ